LGAQFVQAPSDSRQNRENNVADENSTPSGKAEAAGKSAVEASGRATRSIAESGQQAVKTTAETASAIAPEAAQATARISETVAKTAQTATEAQASLLSDFTRIFTDNLRIPNVMMMPDLQGLLGAHRRNMEAFSAANKLALEGAQAVARRHMEIIQQTGAELADQVRELTTADAPQAKAARQTELMKQSYERAVSRLHELRDLIQQSNNEALNLLNHRFTEALDEVKGLFEQGERGRGAQGGPQPRV
jgi:phasin family protein